MSKLDQHSLPRCVRDLVLYEKGAMAFQDKAIPHERLVEILEAITPYVGFAKWRLVAVEEKDRRLEVIEAWQRGLRRIGQHRGAEFIERWKLAPLLLAFYVPREPESFQWVPAEFVRSLALVEIGVALHGLMLVARAQGIETHWIAGALVVGEEINEVLRVPEKYELAFFVVAGYPSEEVVQKFPALCEVCYRDAWGNSFGLPERLEDSS